MRIFKSFRTLVAWAMTIVAIPRKANTAEPHAPYRKCPQCGDRDFRLSDRQRAHPDIYRSRVFLLKWLCLVCGHRETETVEELD